MPFDLFIFDFDGTLVDSTAAKYSAFHRLFPAGWGAEQVVTAVLAEDPEGARENVIAEMLRRLGRPESELHGLVARYTELTDAAVGSAPEFPGATATLRGLRAAGKRVYVSSNTPEGALRRLLMQRGWLTLLDGASGYPAGKIATARLLVDSLGIEPHRIAVIGDGESDRVSAGAVGAQYFPVSQSGDLQKLGISWGLNV